MSAVVKVIKKAVKNVGTAIKRTADAIVKTAEAVIKDPLPTILSIAGQAVGIPIPVTQAAITAARGGDLEDIAKSAAIAYVTPKVAATISPAVNTAVSSVVTDKAAAQALSAATSQSLVAGSLTAATGGDAAQAAAGAFAGSLAASGYDKYLAPEVAAQTKSLGLSPETIKVTQDILKSGAAGGTGTLAAGGDFATGFADAATGAGWDNLTTKVAEGFQDIKKTYLKDQGIKDNPPTAAGIPDKLVDEVPKGQFAQKVPTLEQMLAEAELFDKPTEYGQQYGPPLAALGSLDGIELKPSVAGAGDTTGELLFPDSGEFAIGVNQKAGPISEISVGGKTYLKRDVTENGVTTTHYFDPVDKEVTSAPVSLRGESVVGEEGQITKQAEPLVIESKKDLPPPTPSEQAELIEELKKSAITGDIAPLAANTQLGTPKIEEVQPIKVDAGILPAQQINRLILKASESSVEADRAKIEASVNPTPENVTAAKNATLQAELDKKALEDAKTIIRQNAIETTVVPQQPERVQTPLGSVSLSMARAFGTPQNLLAAIRSGAVKAEPISPTPIKTDTTGITGFASTYAPYTPVDQLILNASNASTAAANAQVEASINPTPENISIAQNAQLNAELAGKELSNAVGQAINLSQPGSQTDGSLGVSTVPGTSTVPSTSSLPGSSSVPGASSVPGDSLVSGDSLLSGTSPTAGTSLVPETVPVPDVIAAPTEPVVDATKTTDTEDLLGDNLPPLEDVDFTETVDTTKTAGVPRPGGVSIPQIVAGGLAALPAFLRPTGPNYLPSKGMRYIPGTPVEIDTNSLIMMSPEEYARRTKLGSMFSVARGGLITLKKQR